MSDEHVKIVLPCANEGEWLRLTVESLVATTDYPSFEIVISANGDTRSDFSFLGGRAFRGRVRLRRTGAFLGVGNSLNAGVRRGDARYYVFLDAHCILERPDWLRRAVACLEAHPEASMVQPEVFNFTYEGEPGPGEPFRRARMKPLYLDYGVRWAWPYDRADYLVQPTPRRHAEVPFEAMAGAGMAIFVRSETFHRLGGFDAEVCGWYHETMDYCIRAWLLGYPMLVDPTIRVLHRSRSRPPDYPCTYAHLIHGALRTAYKYLSPRRRDLVEILFRGHGLDAEVDQALMWLRGGQWLRERACHLRERLRDDDWLFARFAVYERRYGIDQPASVAIESSESGRSK